MIQKFIILILINYVYSECLNLTFESCINKCSWCYSSMMCCEFNSCLNRTLCSCNNYTIPLMACDSSPSNQNMFIIIGSILGVTFIIFVGAGVSYYFRKKIAYLSIN